MQPVVLYQNCKLCVIGLNSAQLFLLLSFRVAATEVMDGMTVVVPRSHTDTDPLGSTRPK